MTRRLGHIVDLEWVRRANPSKFIELTPWMLEPTPIHDQLCAEYGAPSRGTSQLR